jgi:hypothetical protein
MLELILTASRLNLDMIVNLSGRKRPNNVCLHEQHQSSGRRYSVTWKKGESGYILGDKPHAALRTALVMRMKADPQQAGRIVKKLLAMAEAGDINAMKLLFERLEGKSGQSIDMNVSASVDHKHVPSIDERKDRIRKLLGQPTVMVN